MSNYKLGEDSPIPNFIHHKIQRRDGVESLTILEEGEFNVPVDGCIKSEWCMFQNGVQHTYARIHVKSKFMIKV